MEHIAIDLGGRKSQICIRDATGKIVQEKQWATDYLGRFLKGRPKSRVIVETCSESFHVAGQALAAGHEVRVVPGTLVKSLGVGARGIKTDRRDARVLSEVSTRIDLPSVHIPSMGSRSRKTMCGMRDSLVRTRTQIINTIRGFLRTQVIRLRKGATVTLAKRVREYFEEQGLDLAEALERQLETLEFIHKQVVAADRQVKRVAQGDPVCVRLMTVPGVGPITALRFVTAIDDVTRFRNAHVLESYLGLVPGEHSSSEKQRRTSITKAGVPAVRRALVQAAWVAWRVQQGGPLGAWANQVAGRRGKKVAVVALARKIAGILFAMWRDEKNYDTTRSAKPRATVEFPVAG